MNTNRCNEAFGCTYSKSMDQPYPRKCIKCGWPEESAIDQDKVRLSNTRKVGIQEIMQVLGTLEQRNLFIDKIGLPGSEDFALDMIETCNKNIKKILQLN